MSEDLQQAHLHSSGHSDEIAASDRCGCFHCLRTFHPSEIVDWIDDGPGKTAMCPHCGIDSVIGSASGFAVDDAFLRRMQQHWFGEEIEAASPTAEDFGT
jgi:hypothetical protein